MNKQLFERTREHTLKSLNLNFEDEIFIYKYTK